MASIDPTASTSGDRRRSNRTAGNARELPVMPPRLGVSYEALLFFKELIPVLLI
jgi:hypothetical protein